MDTVILKPTKEALVKASQLLADGQLIGMPTETVYGLAANALDSEAVMRIFISKNRPADNPLIVHVLDIESAAELCDLSDTAIKLMNAFCPGALTLLLPSKKNIPEVVNAGLPSIAIRIPAHPVAQALLKACKLPLAAPSANLSGRPSPTTAKHVFDDLNGKIPLILDGGPCEVGLESTVLSLMEPVPTVLRPGGITPEMLLTVLPEVKVADSVMRPLLQGEKVLSPGMQYRHYAPKGQLILVSGESSNVQSLCIKNYNSATQQGKRACILAFEEHLPLYLGCETLSIGRLSNPETIASRLFACLRQLDDEQRDLVLCEILPATGIGLAIMNRLQRAASFTVIDADAIEVHNT